MISIRPSQKLGSERLTSVSRRAAWSIQELRYTAEIRPAGTPTPMESSSDRHTKARVVGNRQRSSSVIRVRL